MRVRHTRIVALLLMAVIATVAMMGSAQAATPMGAAVVTAEEDAINIRGKLVDTREQPPAPVEGVDITVEDDAGEVVGESTSNAQGEFAVPLPGGAADVVGETYTIKIDTETLPEGTTLRSPCLKCGAWCPGKKARLGRIAPHQFN